MRITLALILMAGIADAFFNQNTKRAASSPLAQEAVAIFNKQYPFGRETVNTSPLGNLGVPKQDIDGTPIRKPLPKKGERKSLADITEADAIASFSAIAAVYDEERALNMVKIFPLCLAFDKESFPETFAIFAEKFGEEETKDMVLRNPGLLAVQPSLAKKTDDSTMTFSYIIAVTRPIGAFGPLLLILLLLTPLIEGVTGIPIKETREAFFSGLF
jgi:hypothetical protein